MSLTQSDETNTDRLYRDTKSKRGKTYILNNFARNVLHFETHVRRKYVHVYMS